MKMKSLVKILLVWREANNKKGLNREWNNKKWLNESKK
jgi:hypothetical protein